MVNNGQQYNNGNNNDNDNDNNSNKFFSLLSDFSTITIQSLRTESKCPRSTRLEETNGWTPRRQVQVWTDNNDVDHIIQVRGSQSVFLKNWVVT